MNKQKQINEFVDYVLSFYGDESYDPVYQMNATRDDVLVALCMRLLGMGFVNEHGKPVKDIPFAGDSFDREKVRDVMIANGLKWPRAA